MVAIYFTDAGDNFPVYRLEFGIQCGGVKVGCNWLVEKIVADDSRLIPVAGCELAPNFYG